ncbi:MAG: 4-hydroxy-3-methylbut-2-enyl diphosphate reductase [Bdellovibrionales bacterium]
MKPALKVLLAKPRGFCAGVDRAIQIVEQALAKFGAPVYVRHEIVHNKYVVDTLRAKGAIFVEELDDVPNGAVTVFSAHGVPKAVLRGADDRALPFIDATCPLVTKVHNEGARMAREGREIILIGHKGHPEVIGTMGSIDGTVQLVQTVDDVAVLQVGDPDKLGYITQTTLSVDDTKLIIAALKERFPAIVGQDVKDICYATQNRQAAVRAMMPQVQALLVVGGKNSSNSNRLRDIGAENNRPSFLIDDAAAIQPQWLDGVSVLGISAGASAPEILVQEVIQSLHEKFDVTLEEFFVIDENITFKLPKEITHTPDDFNRRRANS